MREVGNYKDYRKWVEEREVNLKSWATKSFGATYLDGRSIEDRYKEVFQTSLFNIQRNRYRTPFQHDRDRILYSNYFLRLAQKTQLLTNGKTGMVEDRLKHTLRVSQIARSIAVGLGLNEDLVEAIALGHDVGHTPFGHTGEDALNDWIWTNIRPTEDEHPNQQTKLSKPDEPQIVLSVKEKYQNSFKQFFTFGNDSKEKFFMHGRNSFRFLAFMRKPGEAYTNLTREVLFGIWRHSKGNLNTDQHFIYEKSLPNGRKAVISGENSTLESQAVRYADDIAWVVTDLVESMRTGVINYNSDVEKIIDGKCKEGNKENIEFLSLNFRRSIHDNRKTGRIYNYFISDIIETSRRQFKQQNYNLSFSEEAGGNFDLFHENIVTPKIRKSSVMRGDKVKYNQMQALCDWYFNHYKDLLKDFEKMQKRPGFPYKAGWNREDIRDDPIARICLISDFVSTLTDLEADELSGHRPVY